MFKAFRLFWKNYFNFNGTSKRYEFWWMALIDAVVTLILIAAFGGIGAIMGAKGFSTGAIVGVALAVIYNIATIIPNISIYFRRYRDAGVTPWWLLATIVLPTILKSSDFYSKAAWLRTIVFVIEAINLIILVMPSKNKD